MSATLSDTVVRKVLIALLPEASILTGTDVNGTVGRIAVLLPGGFDLFFNADELGRQRLGDLRAYVLARCVLPE